MEMAVDQTLNPRRVLLTQSRGWSLFFFSIYIFLTLAVITRHDMSSASIVLYDIPRNDSQCKSWSSNCWKARYGSPNTRYTVAEEIDRFTLNFKGLPYTTEWVEYPDIAAVCRKLGAQPTSTQQDGTPKYTLPMIYDPSTEAIVTESSAIAKYLDKTYPDTPTLFPEGLNGFQAVSLDTIGPMFAGAFRPFLLSRICGHLNEASAVYFRTTREAAFGKRLEELKTEEQWQKVVAALERLRGYYSANGNGRELLLAGDRVTFCDLQVASIFKWAKITCGEDSEDWKRVMSLHGGHWARFTERFRPYEVVHV